MPARGAPACRGAVCLAGPERVLGGSTEVAQRRGKPSPPARLAVKFCQPWSFSLAPSRSSAQLLALSCRAGSGLGAKIQSFLCDPFAKGGLVPNETFLVQVCTFTSFLGFITCEDFISSGGIRNRDRFDKMIWFWRFCFVQLCKLFTRISPKQNVFF